MATLAELQTQLEELEAAKSAALRAQSYKDPMGVMVTRPDLNVITAEIRRLEARIAILQNGGLSHANAIFKGSR
jgi:hypothetical protein